MKMKTIYYFINNTSFFRVETHKLLLTLPQIVPKLRYSLLAVFYRERLFLIGFESACVKLISQPDKQ
jgi:hypothetical protein